MQSKKKVAHINQAPESLDYNINRGILPFLVMDFLPAPQPAFLTANYFIKHLSMALFIYLSMTLAGLNPTDAQTPLFSGSLSVERCQNILVLFDGSLVKV